MSLTLLLAIVFVDGVDNGIERTFSAITTISYEDILNGDKIMNDNRPMRRHLEEIKCVFQPFEILIDINTTAISTREHPYLVTLPPVSDYHNFGACIKAWYETI